MEQFLEEFQKIKAVYERSASRNSSLVCLTGTFEESPYVRLQRDSWVLGKAGIFFSIWTDRNSASTSRLHYNIHALKLRHLKSHVIASRNFADDFRKNFRAFSSAWPNVSVDFGPLNLMQGWIELRERTFQHDVLALMKQFDQIQPIIDRLLAERIAPVRRGR